MVSAVSSVCSSKVHRFSPSDGSGPGAVTDWAGYCEAKPFRCCLHTIEIPLGTQPMNSFASAALALALLFAAACACGGERDRALGATRPEKTVVGQILLPDGSGSRGVELLLTINAPGSEARLQWVLFDEEGHFEQVLHGSLHEVVVTSGNGVDVYRVDAEELPEINRANEINLGVIDLRDQLERHYLLLRAADGAAHGEVRVAMWFGPPPVGPSGEPVSLGSRQFPPVELGSEMEWLLSPEAQSIYILVERPVEPTGGTNWRSGKQQLFGPFTSADMPTELIVD